MIPTLKERTKFPLFEHKGNLGEHQRTSRGDRKGRPFLRHRLFFVVLYVSIEERRFPAMKEVRSIMMKQRELVTRKEVRIVFALISLFLAINTLVKSVNDLYEAINES